MKIPGQDDALEQVFAAVARVREPDGAKRFGDALLRYSTFCYLAGERAARIAHGETAGAVDTDLSQRVAEMCP